MKKLVLSLLLTAISSNALAGWSVRDLSDELSTRATDRSKHAPVGMLGEWVVVGETRSYVVYADLSSIQVSGDKVTMWDMFDNKTDEQDLRGKKYLSSRSQQEFDCKAETSKQEAALEAASAFPYDASDDYETRYYTNLVLAGPAGVGKTHLAAAMFTNAWIYNGQAADFVTSTALMRKFREKGAKESALLARYGDGKHDATDPLDQGCEFLIIDDIGVEADAYSSQIFCEILDRRIGADLLTVFTTNCTADELRLWLGERGFSRLRSRCNWIALDGDDHRLRENRPKK